MLLIKLNESTASRRRIEFEMIDDTDFISPLTGLTFSGSEIQVRAEGGSLTNFAGTVTEIGQGTYEYEFTTGEVNTLGKLLIVVNKTGAIIARSIAQIVAFDPYDAVRYGLTALPNNSASQSGGLLTYGTGTGQVNVDGTGGMYIALGQTVPASDLTSKTSQTVGDCLSAARADGAGKWVFGGTTHTVYGPDGAQVVRTFTLDSSVNPTQRS